MVSTMKIVDTKRRASRPEFVNGVRVNRTGRRTYTPAYKLRVVRQCLEPGVSVAAVALAHRINANLVRRWLVRHQRERVEAVPKGRPTLLPVTLDAASAPMPRQAAPPVDIAARRRPGGGAAIEIEIYGARIYLRGGVDVPALRSVLDLFAQR